MIWIIGQYADRIDNANELLEIFLESFLEEPVDVRAHACSISAGRVAQTHTAAAHRIRSVRPLGRCMPRCAPHATCPYRSSWRC